MKWASATDGHRFYSDAGDDCTVIYFIIIRSEKSPRRGLHALWRIYFIDHLV